MPSKIASENWTTRKNKYNIANYYKVIFTPLFSDMEDSNPPSTDVNEPHLSLSLYLDRSSATVYRVWSGVGSLHKRGYRDTHSPTHKAALRETTAAFMYSIASKTENILYN